MDYLRQEREMRADVVGIMRCRQNNDKAGIRLIVEESEDLPFVVEALAMFALEAIRGDREHRLNDMLSL